MPIVLIVFLLMVSPAWAIEEFSTVIFHSGSIADGDGQTRPVSHYGTLGVDLYVSGTATITVQGRSTLGESFTALRCVNTSDGTVATAFTATANVQCPVAGIAEVKTVISGCSSCLVRSNGRLTTATMAALSSGAGGGGSFDGILRDGTGDTTQANVTSGRLNVDGSGVTQPVSGTVTVQQGTGTNLHMVCDSGCSSSAGFADNSAFTFGTTAINPIGGVLDDTATNAATENSAAVARITAQKGLHVNLRNNSGTELGTAGAPVRVDPTGTTTQPVSGTVTVTDGAGALNVIVDSSALPSWASTLAEQQTQTTSLQLIDNLPLTQGAATSGQNGVLVQGAVTTAAPTYTTGNTNPISLQTDGSQRVAVTNTPAVTQSGTWNIGSVTTLPALPNNQSVNVAQINGVTPLMGNGTTGTGSPRVTIASDNTAFTVNAAQSGTWTVQPGNTQNTTAWLTQPQGNVAHDAVDSGNPTKIGCHARTTNRTAVADADRADAICDVNGQLVVTPMAPRARVVRSGVVTLSNTTETTLVAAGGAGVFRDLTYLKCTNNSATLVRVDLRDATAGTVIDSWALAASGGGFNLAFSVPYAQATANNNWTVQLSGSVTDVRCSAQAVEKN